MSVKWSTLATLAKSVCMYLWKVELVSFKPNDIITNSKKSKQFVTVVLGTSSGDTGICRCVILKVDSRENFFIMKICSYRS